MSERFKLGVSYFPRTREPCYVVARRNSGVVVKNKAGEQYFTLRKAKEFKAELEASLTPRELAASMPKPLDASEALPCPFCGVLPVIQPWHGGGPRKKMVMCDNEDCHISPSVTGSSKARALEYWNTRAPVLRAGANGKVGLV